MGNDPYLSDYVIMNALLRKIEWKINEDFIRTMINLIYIHKMCVIAYKMNLNYNGVA